MSEIPLTLPTPIAETEPVEPESSNSDIQAPTLSSTSPDSIDTPVQSDSNVRRYPCRQRKPRERFQPGMN